MIDFEHHLSKEPPLNSSTPSVRANLSSFALYLILAGIGLIVLSQWLANDANYVLFRFAAHLANGHGLNYLIPDSAVTTYPLVPVLLAPFANISLPTGVWLLCTVAIAVGAVFMVRLTASRWMAGTAYILASLIYPSPVILVMLALALAGLDFARRQHWIASGVLMGLAILAEPSALVPAALLILLTLRTPRATWRYLLPAISIPILGLILTRIILAPIDSTFVAVVPQIITLALPISAILSLAWARKALGDQPIVGLLVAWSATVVCVALLRGTWPSGAVIPGSIALITLLPRPFIVVIAAAIDLILNLILPNPSAVESSNQALGQWIAAHTSAEATLATSDIGALSYYADRPLIDLSGRLQSNPFDKDFFLRSAPDVIVLNDNTQVPWEGFKTTYARAYSLDGQTVYQRVVNFMPLQTRAVNINFSAKLHRDDLALMNIAITNVAHPGDLVRVRLDWQLNNPSSFDKNINIMLNDGQGKIAVTALDKITAAAWNVGTNSTYHVLVLPGNLAIGLYSVNVEITVNNGDFGPYKAAEVNVTK